MGRIWHTIYLGVLVSITILVFIILVVYGSDYYLTDFGERHFHTLDKRLKPSGLIGHGVGIIGAGLMIFGVFMYMARKRLKILSRLGTLKYWLEFHIFLCTLGPILVLFHTAFKFGGLVSISFWSMVAVVASGVIGRFIYLQIPHTIEGRELSLNELNKQEAQHLAHLSATGDVLSAALNRVNSKQEEQADSTESNYIKRLRNDRMLISQLRKELNQKGLRGKDFRKAIKILKSKIVMNRRIAWLSTMQKLMRYWHAAHLPFALVMLIIMLVHIVVVVLFGYRWIF